MYKLANFWNLMERNANKILSYVKKVDFCPNLHEIYGCRGNVKKYGHAIDISSSETQGLLAGTMKYFWAKVYFKS